MRTTSLAPNTSHRSPNELALLRCQEALELKDQGDYAGVQEIMSPLWKRIGEHPDTSTLHPAVAAEVLLCTGMFTGWIGSKNQIEEAQEAAKNLISESITAFELVGDLKKIAVARAELAHCYWREGALDEARIMFKDALEKLTTEGNTRARALVRLASLEWSASRFSDALKILTANAALFKKITNHAIRGGYHVQFAMVLQKLATAEHKNDSLQRAISEYEEADRHFMLARNKVFRANVQNNIGNVLRELSRFKQAHEHIDHARRLAVSVRDKVLVAQFDDSRAQVLIVEGKFKEAEAVMRSAVAVLEKSGRQCLLAETLVTYGIALARLNKPTHAQFTFQRGIEVAHQVGAFNLAGLAALAMIEELHQLPSDLLCAAYDQANRWLAKSQGEDMSPRLGAAARKVIAALDGKREEEQATEILLKTSCDLQEEVTRYEGALISRALANVDGSLTRAAKLLRTSYQGLAYIIEARHKNLLKERTPVRRRARKNQRI
jgi:tetratricopeptide (TPR) repeat protein